MANEVFERVHHLREARKGSKESFACKSWKPKSFVGLFLVSLFLVPNLSWSAQPTVRMAQPLNALAFLPVYVARANGYFNDEGVTLELIIVQGGADLAALIGESVDFDATSTGGAYSERSAAEQSS